MRNKFGFVRVAAAVPELKVADIDHNLQKTTALIREAARQGAEFVVFPELGIPGYSCGDLFAQRLLLEESKEAMLFLARETGRAGITVVVGLPFAFRDHGMTGKNDVGGRFTGTRRGVGISRQSPGRLLADQFPPIGSLAQNLVAGGRIQDEVGSCQAKVPTGRLDGPQILADLHPHPCAGCIIGEEKVGPHGDF